MSAPRGRDPGRRAHEGRGRPGRAPGTDVAGVIAAVLAGAGVTVFGVGLLRGAPLVVYGSALTIALAGMAVALRRYFALGYPFREAVEPRRDAAETSPHGEPVGDVTAVARRSAVRRLVVAAAAVLGLSLAAPVASLGPRPGAALRRTAWRAGIRLVTTEGMPLRPGDVAAGGFATAWPEGAVGDERSAVILVRLSPRGPQPPTNRDWVVDGGLVGYSKICTHAGCPVGLFRERDDALFCPCHQTTFDAARAATPTFGPAARPLPQLPMEVGDDGVLVALGDFTEQVGPAFGWLPR